MAATPALRRWRFGSARFAGGLGILLPRHLERRAVRTGRGARSVLAAKAPRASPAQARKLSQISIAVSVVARRAQGGDGHRHRLDPEAGRFRTTAADISTAWWSRRKPEI